jgi:hypothetical protein
MLLVLLLVFAFAFAANAQTIFGITGGVNMAKMTGDDVEVPGYDQTFIMGIAGGLFANMPIGEGLAFRPEVLYSQTGGKWEAGDDYYKMIFSYIGVPLMLQYTIAAGDALGILLMGGGYFGYNISAQEKWDIGGVTGDDDVEDVNSIDYGLVFGGGVVINNMIEIFVRYSMGLADVPDEEGVELDIKNSAIEIRGGFRFGGN